MLKLLNDLKICDGILLKQEEQAVQEEQEERAAQSFLLNWNFPMIDDDDDEHTILYRSSKEITPDLPTEEPNNSLSMGDEHLSTIPETESDKLIKYSVENLVPIPRESEEVMVTDKEKELNRSKNGQNQAREWKEHEKPSPRFKFSLYLEACGLVLDFGIGISLT
ncbi:hypothetical protein Tco_0907382 [Tanacetum coccineum]|uniref:Uncharacterized protein n=1 Tax=Tanacetum coccineum TaxID=301880 RepID=A0ABQ5CM17_9ASTR